MSTTDLPPAPPQGAADVLQVVRRDGTTTHVDPTRITVALTKAFLEVEGDAAAASSRVREVIAQLTDDVLAVLRRRVGPSARIHVEDVQDQVELALMRAGHHQVARAYVLYREAHAQARPAPTAPTAGPSIGVRGRDGQLAPLNIDAVTASVAAACEGLADVDPDAVVAELLRTTYDGITAEELELAAVMAARTLVEADPAYSQVAARLLADRARAEALAFLATDDDALAEHLADHQAATGAAGRAQDDAVIAAASLAAFVRRGIALDVLDPRLAEFDLERLGQALRPERDRHFTYLGLQTLYDRYFLHHRGTRYEQPQVFFMRVAMGLAISEIDRDARAIEFYELLSSLDFMASTPTLFNAGTRRPQLSSCFLTTVTDDLEQIFGLYRSNALLAKYSGGLGNDWTPVRGIGARINGTNGESSGVVPFLKIANDTAVAVNQGGKRKGAVCAYLETWHIDIEEFLDLRKNTGDDRRRTHDMNTASWVPDLFMQRVEAGGTWTLFSPDEVPDLHDLYGTAFAERYVAYEAAAARGELAVHRTVQAVDLWRRMLTSLFETGHPWITFKDACNVRSPQQHAGVVHSSNLCTEITLNTSPDEIAVCNLGSVNLATHVTPEGIDRRRLERTVTTAVRMLDNVIDLNLYTVPEARRSNLRHRPVGLGMMGFQDALFTLRIPYASQAAVELADTTAEAISYHAISASADLAAERGAYASFDGSLWSRGVLPIDSLELLDDVRGGDLDVDRSRRLDWDALRDRVRSGMRNSNVLAIAPTATISNICGVGQSIEPQYANLFVKSNMSGDFTVTNAALVADLKARGLWDEVMVGDLKYFDGVLAPIARIPDDLKALYATAFEIDPIWLVRAGSRRQKWLDQSQSLNLYLAQPSGRQLDELYRAAWRTGLKTTYYLRSQAATHVEKSTLAGTDGRLNAVAPAAVATVPSPGPVVGDLDLAPAAACTITDPDCEACQ